LGVPDNTGLPVALHRLHRAADCLRYREVLVRLRNPLGEALGSLVKCDKRPQQLQEALLVVEAKQRDLHAGSRIPVIRIAEFDRLPVVVDVPG
jgi:hypothetical protein